MNPMENVWAVLKANISNYKPTSTKHLIRKIKKNGKSWIKYSVLHKYPRYPKNLNLKVIGPMT